VEARGISAEDPLVEFVAAHHEQRVVWKWRSPDARHFSATVAP
jgi:hypothetical protein